MSFLKNRFKHFLTAVITAFLAFIIFNTCSKNPVNGIVDLETTPQVDDFPAWSPDGKTISFYHSGLVAYDPKTDMGEHVQDSVGLWFIAPDGSQRKKVLSGYINSSDWSPDGQWVVFGVNAQIYKARVADASLDNSSITQLTSAGRNFFPSWSPDGKWIAYDRSLADSTGPGGIWIMNSDGNNKKSVLAGMMADWHPNKSNLIVVKGTDTLPIWMQFVIVNPFMIVAAETLDAVIDADNLYPSYSPDGLEIVFQSDLNIWKMDSSGKNLQQLTHGKPTSIMPVFSGGMTPNWSPDGKQIVYVGPQTTLWIMDADGANKRQLTFLPEKKPAYLRKSLHTLAGH